MQIEPVLLVAVFLLFIALWFLIFLQWETGRPTKCWIRFIILIFLGFLVFYMNQRFSDDRWNQLKDDVKESSAKINKLYNMIENEPEVEKKDMKYALMFFLLAGTPTKPELRRITGPPVVTYENYAICRDTAENGAIRKSYEDIYGPDLIITCVPIGQPQTTTARE